VTEVDRKRGATAQFIVRASFLGVAVGAALLPDHLSSPFVWRLVVSVVGVWLLFWAASALAQPGRRIALGLAALDLIIAAALLGSVLVSWTRPCLSSGWCGGAWVVRLGLSWLLLVGAPLAGGIAAGRWAIRPESMSHGRFEQLSWLLVVASACGLVMALYGWESLWYWIVPWGAMAVIVVGEVCAVRGYRSVAVALGFALSATAAALVLGWGAAIALGCAMQGSCGWSAGEALTAWLGVGLVAGSLIAAGFSLPWLASRTNEIPLPAGR
jgi:hypothetical protein